MKPRPGIEDTIERCYRAGLGQVIYLYGVRRYGSTWCCACKRGPDCANPGKHPRWIKGEQEHGSHDGCADAEQARQRWAGLRPGQVNIGIVPAAAMIVLDIDPRNGGHDALARLEQAHGGLPDTLSAHTGGGGEHRWWQTSGRTGWKASIGPGLDIKTAGGFLVVPPSQHANEGKRYHWRRAVNPDPVQAPAWLVAVAQIEREATSGTHHRRPVTKLSRPEVIAEQMRETTQGRRVKLFKLACWAIRAGADLDELRDAARETGLSPRVIDKRINDARGKAWG